MEKQRRLAGLSPAQEEIMEIVWERGEVTVNDVCEVIGRRRPVARNTIQTLMVRMQSKGWLQIREIGQAHVFSAAQSREKSLSQRVKELLRQYFDGSALGLVNSLLDDQSLSASEANQLRKLIDQAENRKKTKRKR